MQTRSHGVRERAICEPLRRIAHASCWRLHGVCDARVLQAVAAAKDRFGRIVARHLQTLRRRAIESTVRRRSGLQNARIANTTRTPQTDVRVVFAMR
eukprot:599334-Lingulodinium_polyedra.AAC.1